MFPNDWQDIEFIEDFLDRHLEGDFDPHFAQLWKSPVRKKDVRGVNGILFDEMLHKKKYYLIKMDSELNETSRLWIA